MADGMITRVWSLSDHTFGVLPQKGPPMPTTTRNDRSHTLRQAFAASLQTARSLHDYGAQDLSQEAHKLADKIEGILQSEGAPKPTPPRRKTTTPTTPAEEAQ